MKVLTTTGLSKLIELSKDTFVDKTDTTQVSLVTLANVATTGDYNDLSNKPSASDFLPAQSGNSGKFLTTNGTTASWTPISQLPSQTGNSGKYLTTNGSAASWVSLTIPTTTDSVTSGSTAALTSGGAYTNLVTKVEAGDTANKIKVTKAGSASTITINNVANATTASKLGSTTVGGTTTPIYLDNGTATALSYTIAKSVPSDAVFTDTTYTNGAGISLSGTTFSANCDTTTVSTNSSSKLQSIGVIDKQSSSAVYTWKGTLAQYNALTTKNNNWIYYITDDGAIITEDYYTKAQTDALLYNTDHSITKNAAKLVIHDTNTNADITNVPSGNDYNGGIIEFQDKNGDASGYVYTSYKTNGDIEQVLEVNKSVNNEIVSNTLAVGIDANGNKYVETSKPATSGDLNNTNVVTAGWVNDPAYSTNVVHRTGVETVAGVKTFTGNNIHNGTNSFSNTCTFSGLDYFVDNNNTALFTVSQLIDNTVTPVGDRQFSNFIDNLDMNGVRLSRVFTTKGTDGINGIAIQAWDGATNYCIEVHSDGTAYLPPTTYGTTFNGTTFTGTANRALYADLAENYQSDEQYSVGTLIKFGGEKDITIADTEVHGVVSDKPGYLLDSGLEDSLPVALVGKTPIRIVGKVNKFDKITLSEIPGVARVAKEGEKVIAKSLETVENEEEKLVLCVTKFTLD